MVWFFKEGPAVFRMDVLWRKIKQMSPLRPDLFHHTHPRDRILKLQVDALYTNRFSSSFPLEVETG